MKKTFLSLFLGSLLACQLFGCGKAPAVAPAESETVSESTGDTASEADNTGSSDAPSVQDSEAAAAEDASEIAGEASSETEGETSSEEESAAATEEISESPADPADFSDDEYVGNWYERYAQRGYMTVTKEGNEYCFQINWANSAAESYCWTFSAIKNEAGVIAYHNCKKVLITWDEKDNETEEVIEENAVGSVYIAENGHLMWNEHDDMPEPNEFIKE